MIPPPSISRTMPTTITNRLRLRPVVLLLMHPDTGTNKGEWNDQPVQPAEQRNEGDDRADQRDNSDDQGNHVEHALNPLRPTSACSLECGLDARYFGERFVAAAHDHASDRLVQRPFRGLRA